MTAVRAYVGLGSNLDDPARHVRAALDELAQVRATRLVAHSRLYGSAPMGPAGQPDYVNAVAALDTTLAPLELLDALFAIEHAHGRVRTLRWGPRTLDLDLLLWGDLILTGERLTLPHPGLRERNFVLVPLDEIAPGLLLPGGVSLHALAEACPRDGLRPLDGAGAAP